MHEVKRIVVAAVSILQNRIFFRGVLLMGIRCFANSSRTVNGKTYLQTFASNILFIQFRSDASRSII